MSEFACDVVIVGGGPIGAAVAITLRGSGLSVLVLEARPDGRSSNDARTLAMSYGSRLILERLGVWPQIEPVTPIESIHVSQRGGFGRTLMSADEVGLPALGYVARYARLQQALGRAIESPHTRLIAGAEVTSMNSSNEVACVGFHEQGEIHSASARLLIVADGGATEELRAGTRMKVLDYGQDAIVGLVETSKPNAGRAYERFTPEGPIALLPFEGGYALVWTATPETANRLMALPGDNFLDKLQPQFGDRVGRFISVGHRARFSLKLRYAADQVLPRAVLLGNAAQALHPIAGQGFNLGLRDAWELGERLLLNTTRDPGSNECLSVYRTTRRPDRLRGIALTHSLVKIFSNDIAPLRLTRGFALALLELIPPVKRVLMQRMIFGAGR